MGKLEKPEGKKLRYSPNTERKQDISGEKTDWKRPNNNFEAGEWAKPCLYMGECSGIHSISKCPVTTKEKRRELLDKHFGTKRKKKSGTAAVLRLPSGLGPKAEERRYKILLNDIQAVALGNSGANYSTIPSDVFESISEKYPGIPDEVGGCATDTRKMCSYVYYI